MFYASILPIKMFQSALARVASSSIPRQLVHTLRHNIGARCCAAAAAATQFLTNVSRRARVKHRPQSLVKLSTLWDTIFARVAVQILQEAGSARDV